jgi:hypothetical protein
MYENFIGIFRIYSGKEKYPQQKCLFRSYYMHFVAETLNSTKAYSYT